MTRYYVEASFQALFSWAGSDAVIPGEHVERLRELDELGATIVVLQNNSGAAPMKAIEVYGEEVLPALRAERVAR